MIDSHVHFWNYHPVKDAWITDEMKVIQRNFLPEDLILELQNNEVSACVAVQADQSEIETDFLVQLAEENSFIRGVVGWTDLNSNDIAFKLEQYSEVPFIKGWRHIVQAETAGYMDDLQFRNGISHLSEHQFTYDILIHHHQLKEATRLVRDFPQQPFVLDHIAKPEIKSGENKSQWADEIKNLAKYQNIYCKLSGLVTEADWQHWNADDFKFYLDTVLDNFGPNRLMFGSDWPVCTLAGNYKQIISIIKNHISKLSVDEQQAIMKINALNFYKL